jgi:hypothetical protein
VGVKLKDSVEQREAESDQQIRLPDGGFANINAGDKVYTTESGWVYHHPAENEPDWDEVKRSHSNPALVEDLLEEDSGESQPEQERPDQAPDDGLGFEDSPEEPDREQEPTRTEPQTPRRRRDDL